MKDWKEVTLKVSDSLEKAISVLHHGGLRVALVIDKKNKLLGTITDGDIRRALLKHQGMDSSVESIMNNNPTVALSSDSMEVVMLKMKSRDLLHIPIVDENNQLIGLETLQHLVYEKKSYGTFLPHYDSTFCTHRLLLDRLANGLRKTSRAILCR